MSLMERWGDNEIDRELDEQNDLVGQMNVSVARLPAAVEERRQLARQGVEMLSPMPDEIRSLVKELKPLARPLRSQLWQKNRSRWANYPVLCRYVLRFAFRWVVYKTICFCRAAAEYAREIATLAGAFAMRAREWLLNLISRKK